MNLRVKEICKSKGLLMEELAQKLGIARVNLTKAINGNPTIETLEKISSALGVGIEELFVPKRSDDVISVINKGELFQFYSVEEFKKYADGLVIERKKGE